MHCGDCKFSLLCWSGRLGTDIQKRRNMSLCPCCGRLTLHFMATPMAFIDEDEPIEELLRVESAEWARKNERQTVYAENSVPQERHFIFYCEHRFVDDNINNTWKKHYHNAKIVGWYRDTGHGTNHFNVRHFEVPGNCEIRPCYPCAGHKRKSFNARIIELDPMRDLVVRK